MCFNTPADIFKDISGKDMHERYINVWLFIDHMTTATNYDRSRHASLMYIKKVKYRFDSPPSFHCRQQSDKPALSALQLLLLRVTKK